jgi:hypothetical protein
VSLIKSQRVSWPSKLNLYDPIKDKMSYRFYNGIMADQYGTDQDAIAQLYGQEIIGGHGDNARNKFKALKKSVKDRLLLGIIYTNKAMYPTNHYPGGFMNCHIDFLIGRLLLFLGARLSGRRLVYTALLGAKDLEIYEIALMAATVLRKLDVHKGNLELFLEYEKMIKDFYAMLGAENEIDGIYYNLQLPFAKKMFVTPVMQKDALEGLQKASGILENCPGFQVRSVYYNIKIIYLQVHGEARLAVAACDEAIAHLEGNTKLYSEVRMSNILLRKIDCLMLVRDITPVEYKELFGFVSQCEKAFLAGSINWYKIQELYFLMCLQIPENTLDRAVAAYSAAIKHAKFKLLEEQEREKWYIYEGYLWLIMTRYGGHEDRIPVFGKRKKYDLGKLYNETRTVVKDKKGMYISFLILESLIFLQENKAKELEKMTERLKNYLTLHLRSDNNRGRNFVRLLIALIEGKGKLNKNRTLITKLEKALERTESAITAAQAQVEVISYTQLWKLAQKLTAA